MKKIKVSNEYGSYEIKKSNILWFNYIYKNLNTILILFNLLFSIYLFIQYSKINSFIYDLKNKTNENNHYSNTSYNKSEIDIDMIGLKYPEILYDKLKQDIANGLIPSSLIDFLTQLQIKLIYLEKEINVTKLNTFYTSRTIYLKKKNIDYNDSDIRVFHTIMSWLVIHKSTQLKGIASDKYLGCKYAKMKIGKNLCEQRIGIFDNVEEIDFIKLKKIGNVILKISNGCNDSVLITNTTKESIEQIKEKITSYYNRDFSLIVPDFFHSYSKKRIVLEKLFSPIEDLFEFKFMVFNNEIKMIILTLLYKEYFILFILR